MSRDETDSQDDGPREHNAGEFEVRNALVADELRTAGYSGIRAVLASRVVFELGGLLSTLFIARLITPEDLGRAAIALIAPMAATVLTYEGFGAALVQRDRITAIDVRTATGLALIAGAGLTITLGLFALTIAPRIFDSETAHLLLLVSPTFTIAAAATNARTQMQRQLLLARLVRIETLNFVVTTTVALTLALAGLGAYALVIGAILGMLTETAAGWRTFPPVRPALDASAARSIGAYGSFASLAGLAFVLRQSVAYPVLGAAGDARTAGLFARAVQTSVDNQARVSGVLMKVSFPLLSRAPSLVDMQRLRRQMVAANALIVMPLLALLAVTASDVVPLLYGPQWAPAVGAAQILTIAGGCLALLSGAEAFAFARGRPHDVVVFNLFALATLLTGVLLTAHDGLLAVSVAVVIAYSLQLMFAQYWLIGRLGELPMRTLVVDAAPAVSGAAIVWTFGTVLHPSLDGIPAPLRIAVVGFASALAYVAFLRVLWPGQYREFGSRIGRLLARTQRA